MSYQVIARKWRPQAFEEVTGQGHITQTLLNAIEFDRLHHAYLFSGARGVGKTTTARLLAKALNCHKTDKPNLNPCKTTDADACPSCKEIAESRSIDVLEFDAASNTQVDKIREIIVENINIGAARDRFKIFIIDEVHMLSTSSFNALLKTVEEPPPNVVFIMATTELHKVPETITSRCQEFIFRTIPQQKIFERLKLIADAEKIDISEAALRELARSGEGSMRDAQSNFDQVISFSGAKIEVGDVTSALGMASRDTLVASIKAIAEKDAAAQLAVVEKLTTEGHDLRSFCRDLLSVIRDLMVYKVAGDSETLLAGAMLETVQIEELAANFSESDLIRFFNSVAETETKLKDATQPRHMLELGLVRLVEMRRLTSIDTIFERLAVLEKANCGVPTSEIKSETPLSQAAAAEKKTLKFEPAEPDWPEPDFDDRPPESEFEEPFEPPPIRYEAEQFPVRYVEIPPEMLEHFEHKRLDDAYEDTLLYYGDDLSRFAFASELAATFAETRPLAAAASASNGPTRIDPKYSPPIAEEDADLPLPILSDTPTEEELFEFAKRHPKIRKVARALRATVVEVERVGN
ncbi:MAG: DNA polymerase III subunit gamma/tau [Pyrinomonadaceae bacterium]